MALDAKAGFAGLVTAAAEATGAPTGLRIADNVTLRKEGALIPRPVYASTALSRTYAAAFPYRGQLWYVGANNAVYTPSQSPAIYPATGSAPPAIRADIQSAREARGNLYVASAIGAFKVTAASDTSLRPTGLRASSVTIYTVTANVSTGSPLILANNQQVAYRVVAKYTDPNGVVVRSRPTGAVVVTNTSGANRTPLVALSIAAATAAGFPVFDEAEIYRSRVFPTTSTIDDEMQLVATLPASAFTIGGIIAEFTDRVLDAERGTTLYTSPSRGGIENANDRAPGCACIERYRGSLFFGNTRGPQQITVSWKYGGQALAGSATGIGGRTITGNTTNGSASITSVTPTAGLRVGQFINGTNVAGYITAIAGSTLTVSPAATGTASGTALSAYDQIWVGPVNAGGSPYTLAFSGASGTSATTSYAMAAGMDAYELTPPRPGYDVTLVIRENQRSAAPLEIRATHGEEMSPPLALTTSGTPTYTTSDILPHGLAWSEPDEPEHVPPKNFARVGDAGKAILALVATKDRLLIFKEDGLFMLAGNTARDFGIYPLDTTCLCILPGSIRRLKNTVFVLTNLGLCAVDENGGVTVISRPIQLEVAAIVNAIRASQKATGLYNMPGLTGVTGAGDDAQGEYHLALGSSTPSFGGQVLVYSIPRDGFTTF